MFRDPQSIGPAMESDLATLCGVVDSPQGSYRVGDVERWARRNQVHCLMGVDEAGKGPLAGPVVAAAVILPPRARLPGLNDSKKLNERQREALFPMIQARATAVGTGIVSAQKIDEIGIQPATYAAMTAAIQGALESGIVPTLIAVDGHLQIPKLSLPQRAFIKGDGRSRNIAAASIIAKVTRDRLMGSFHEQWPEYDFQKHKGYGTRAHRDAIRKLGPCPIHRRCFRGVLPE